MQQDGLQEDYHGSEDVKYGFQHGLTHECTLLAPFSTLRFLHSCTERTCSSHSPQTNRTHPLLFIQTPSAMDIDKPLDEIIDQKRSERRSTRGRGRGGARGGGAARGAPRGGAAASTGPVRNRHVGNAAAAAGPAASAPGKPVIPLMADGSKIIVSNLPIDVTENQIRVSCTCLPNAS